MAVERASCLFSLHLARPATAPHPVAFLLLTSLSNYDRDTLLTYAPYLCPTAWRARDALHTPTSYVYGDYYAVPGAPYVRPPYLVLSRNTNGSQKQTKNLPKPRWSYLAVGALW
ncbi:hypothetical protein EDB83DRAFT_2678505 [Lactarius deliciosus]|nr:hypothetical protein EDB83DRAFT_2678505 [Lactarius deliciosus]